LAHDSYNDVNVMTMKSNGDVDIPGSLNVGGTPVIQTVAVGTVTTGTAGGDASVTASTQGTTTTFSFTIPRGDKGNPGNNGADGSDGVTPIIQVNPNTVTETAGGDASVEASTDGAVTTFTFTIPRGDKGEPGDPATINASSSAGNNTIVQRDGSGNFAAGIITATGFSGGGSALSGLNASNVSTGTLAVDRGGTGQTSLASVTVGAADVLTTARTINGQSFNGSTNITISANTPYSLTAGTDLSGSSFNGGSAITFNVESASTNTANKIVKRDGNGNFAAGTITATGFSGGGSALSGLNASNVSTGLLSTALGGTGETSLSNVTVGAATQLATARTINGQSFNGTTNITISANTPYSLTAGTDLSGSSFNGGSAITFNVESASTNTANKIVKRDGSGNFAAETITANAFSGGTTTLSGDVVARNIQLTNTGITTSFSSGTLSVNADNKIYGTSPIVSITGNMTAMSITNLIEGSQVIIPIQASGGDFTISNTLTGVNYQTFPEIATITNGNRGLLTLTKLDGNTYLNVFPFQDYAINSSGGSSGDLDAKYDIPSGYNQATYEAFVNGKLTKTTQQYDTDLAAKLTKTSTEYTNDLAAKANNTDLTSSTLRIQNLEWGQTGRDNITGGGTVTFNSSGVLKWTGTIVISPGKKNNVGGALAYYRITLPANGVSITRYFSSITTTFATAEGIPMSQGEALYYRINPDQDEASRNENFALVYGNATTNWVPDGNWILIAVRGSYAGNDDSLKWMPGSVVMPLGSSFNHEEGQLYAPGRILQFVSENVHAITAYGGNIKTITELRVSIIPKLFNSKMALRWVINNEMGENNVFRILRSIDSLVDTSFVGPTLIGFNNTRTTNSVLNGVTSAMYDINVDSTIENIVIEFDDYPILVRPSIIYYDIQVYQPFTGNTFFLNRTAASADPNSGGLEVTVSYKSAMEIGI
jgi:hypothetical protein